MVETSGFVFKDGEQRSCGVLSAACLSEEPVIACNVRYVFSGYTIASN